MSKLGPLLVLLIIAALLFGGIVGYGYIFANYIAPLQVQEAYDQIPQSIREDPDAALTFNAQENVVEVALKGFETNESISRAGFGAIQTVVIGLVLTFLGGVIGTFVLLMKLGNKGSA